MSWLHKGAECLNVGVNLLVSFPLGFVVIGLPRRRRFVVLSKEIMVEILGHTVFDTFPDSCFIGSVLGREDLQECFRHLGHKSLHRLSLLLLRLLVQ